MKTLLETCGTQDDIDPQLEQLIESISKRMQGGELIDLEGLVAQHPEFAEALRELVPAVAALVKLGEESREQKPAEEAAGLPNLACSFQQLGDFHLIREIGRGGMGTVYEAEQLSMGRRVALKVLPFAALAHDKSVQRFRNEVRAAAALDHPHIVSVYSVGEDRGVHYYAMQLIRGQTLAELITEFQASRPGSSRPDSGHMSNETTQDGQARIRTVVDSRQAAERYRSLARLGIQAAEAIQHAHDFGVLHRDIKPSNLILDGEGQLYITDFGLARIEADAGLTMTGDLLGTLRYMAPEQALAKRVVIDHRADIYSLGATLYELITLQPAFDEVDRSELLKQIAFDEPKSLRKHDRRVPAELETIVLKAMNKEPDERYQSAQQFADDLNAFLQRRPIKARPLTLFGRFAKWSQRHVAVVLAAAAFCVAFASILVVSNVRISNAYRKAQTQERSAKAVSGFLQQMLAAADPGAVSGENYTVRQLMDRLSSELDNQFADQPEIEASLRLTVARSYFGLHLLDRAEPHFQKSLELRRRLDPDSLEVAEVLSAQAWNQYNLGRFADAFSSLERAIAIYRNNGLPRDATLEAMRSYITFLRWNGRGQEADAIADEAINIAGDLEKLDNPSAAGLLHDIAFSKMKEGDLFNAEQLERKAVEIHRRLNGEKSPATAWGLTHLGLVLRRRSNFDEAESAQRESLEIFRQLYGQNYTACRVVLFRLAIALCEQGKYTEAGLAKEEALEGYELALRERTIDADSSEVIALYLATSKWQVIRDGRVAVQLASNACEMSDYKIPYMLSTLASAYAEDGDFRQAVKWAEKSVDMDPDFPRFSRRLQNFRQGKPWREEQE